MFCDLRLNLFVNKKKKVYLSCAERGFTQLKYLVMDNTTNTKVERVIFPPNKPMDRKLAFSISPKLYPTFNYIDFNKEGNSILGCSNSTGTFWEGTLLYFNEVESMITFNNLGHYIYASTSDGKFLGHKTITLAEDTGNINVLSVDDDTKLRSINYFKLKEQVKQLGVWNNSSKILSCSGTSVDIWEGNSSNRNPIEQFRHYHLDTVNTVDTLRTDENCFISGGRDKTCCIWDIRMSVPLSVLYSNEFSPVTSVSWNQDDENYIAVGTEAGDLYVVDKREPEQFVSVTSCFDAPIHRVAVNKSKIAVCGDTNEVLVVNFKDCVFDVIYNNNNNHTNIVRDVKWHNDVLYSCGYDACLVKHVIPACA